jgi:NAD(P)-dependent dehydrogenase (short-subunit alcohol dehydrogenase family)
VHALDVTNGAASRALATEFADEPVDVLVNNAGVGNFGGSFGGLDYAERHRTLDVDALGPVGVAEAFTEHMARRKKRVITAVTSRMGSIEDNTSGSYYTYRSSKASLNMTAAVSPSTLSRSASPAWC